MSKNILIIEDDTFLGNILKTKLTKEGFNVTYAPDGDEGLKCLSKQKFDLILLDLIMPVKDGFEVLAAINKDPKLTSAPIIVASNLGQDEDITKALALGAKDYVVKTDIPLEDIIKKINASL